MASGIMTGMLPDKTAGPIAVDAFGSLSVGGLNSNVFKPFAATTITNETTIWDPTAGKKFQLLGFVITQSVATGDVTLRDGTAGTTILVIPANTVGVALAVPLGAGLTSATADNVLTAQGASTEKIAGFVYGREL